MQSTKHAASRFIRLPIKGSATRRSPREPRRDHADHRPGGPCYGNCKANATTCGFLGGWTAGDFGSVRQHEDWSSVSSLDYRGHTDTSRHIDLLLTRVDVPEPGPLALFALGLLGLGVMRRGRLTTP